ncbi:MAG: hypothetical protein SNJ63_10145, partial [Sphingomonadaceae bacterium]
ELAVRPAPPHVRLCVQEAWPQCDPDALRQQARGPASRLNQKAQRPRKGQKFMELKIIQLTAQPFGESSLSAKCLNFQTHNMTFRLQVHESKITSSCEGRAPTFWCATEKWVTGRQAHL